MAFFLLKVAQAFNHYLSLRKTLFMDTKIVEKFLQILFFILSSNIFISPVTAADTEYRFARMVPQVEPRLRFVSADNIEAGKDNSIWISDSGANQILHFNANGTVIGRYGSYGAEAGQFDMPQGIAVASDSSVWIVDFQRNRRIQHLDKYGNFIGQFGLSAVPDAEVSSLRGIAVAQDGTLWIVESTRGRILHFDPMGHFLGQIGNSGNSAGQFEQPLGIAIAPDRSLWVADTSNQRIQHFTPDGHFIAQFGSYGNDPGQLQTPHDLAIAADGTVWVTNFFNNRVQHFTAGGQLLQELNSTFDHPSGIAVAEDGSLWVLDASQSALHFSSDGSLIANLGKSNSEFTPYAIAASKDDGGLWVTDTIAYISGFGFDPRKFNHRIQRRDSQGLFSRQFGSLGQEPGELSGPLGIVEAPDNTLWVADTGNCKIQHLKADGSPIANWGDCNNRSFLYAPSGITVAADGSIWVVDGYAYGYRTGIGGYDRILHLSADGNVIAQFGSSEIVFCCEHLPSIAKGIAAVADRSIWITDPFKNTITHMAADGKIISQFGTQGSGPGQFYAPSGIAVAPDNSLWIADTGNNRLQHFSPSGEFLEQLGSQGNAAGQFNLPQGLALTSDGSLWVSESGNQRLQQFVPSTKSRSIHPYKAIVVAGGGATIANRSNRFWESITQLGQHANSVLQQQGFKAHEEVLLLTAGNTQNDLDDNGKNDDLQPASKASLRQAIVEWANDANDVVLYIISQGGVDQLQINATETLSGTELSAWLIELEAKIPGKVTVIIDAPHSGSFIQSLAKQTRPRIVITSSNIQQSNVLAHRGINSFSYAFWSQINAGVPLKLALRNIQPVLTALTIDDEVQQLQVDSNADGQSNTRDFDSLGDYCLGKCNINTPPPLFIKPLAQNDINLQAGTSLDLKISIQHSEKLSEAWVLVQRPDALHIDPNKAIDIPSFPLNCVADECSVRIDNLDFLGQYYLSFFLMDTLRQISLPSVMHVSKNRGKEILPAEYDAEQGILYLRNVMVGRQHYQAELGFQNGRFNFWAATTSGVPWEPAATFDPVNNLLQVPLAQVFGQLYQGSFKHLGNYSFELLNVKPK